jgi:hypothetical protein
VIFRPPTRCPNTRRSRSFYLLTTIKRPQLVHRLLLKWMRFAPWSTCSHYTSPRTCRVGHFISSTCRRAETGRWQPDRLRLWSIGPFVTHPELSTNKRFPASILRTVLAHDRCSNMRLRAGEATLPRRIQHLVGTTLDVGRDRQFRLPERHHDHVTLPRLVDWYYGSDWCIKKKIDVISKANTE